MCALLDGNVVCRLSHSCTSLKPFDGFRCYLTGTFLRAKAATAFSASLQERIASKPVEIDMDKLRMKFLALNVDFNGPSVDFRFKETCAQGRRRAVTP